MRRPVFEWRGLWVACAILALIAGPVWVGLTGLGVAPLPAAVVAVALLAILAWWIAPALQPSADFLGRHPWQAITCAAACAMAVVLTLALALFMRDPQRREWSAQPRSDFYVAHACLTALTNGLDRVRAGDNAYAPADRAARVGGFEIDTYLYAPPFLLLPAALRAFVPDFDAMRSLWFGLQAVSTLAALLIVARHIGGKAGARALAAIPFLWLAPPFLLNLQIENVQVTALATAMVGMTWLFAGRSIAGSALLAFAIISKLFPGVLLVFLVARRQWRWTALVLGWCLAFGLLGVAAFGWSPVGHYLQALPGILSGEATAVWTADLGLAPSNQSIYGATRKLVALGVDFVTPRLEQLVQMAFGVAVLAIAAMAGGAARDERLDARGRLGQAIVWLALLNLASFRSPFLPDGYAYVGTIWLGTLLLASVPRVSWTVALAFAAGWMLLSPIFGGRPTAPQPFKLVTAIALLTQGGVLAITAASVWRESRWGTVAARAPVVPDSLERMPA